ncbi:MAG: type II secretion system protein [Methylotenera sp.]|jgi:MSHA pilin protein MshD|nr:type II secretion system protein [Methylotenera sp.]
MYTNRTHTRGVTLVELVVFIVIISVALVGILKVLEITNRGSADPLIRKQALAIAESLLLEIQQQSFTYCDPNDANASTATSIAACAATAQDPNPAGTGNIAGPFPNTESRYSNTNPFDNVADYGGFTMPSAECAGICHAGDATPLAGLNNYSASVSITRAGGAFALANDAALKINVTVTGPGNTEVSIAGYRVRYAPNS